MKLDVQVLTPWANTMDIEAVDRRIWPFFSRGFYLHTGSACNQHCRYCFLDQTGFERWENVVRAARLAQRLGYHHPLLIGGEPLVYLHLEKLLDVLGKCRIEGLGVMTNGIVLADQERLDHLIAQGVSFFHISFDSNRPAVQNYLARNPQLFATLMTAFQNLGRFSNITVALGAVVTNLNADHLVEHVRFINTLRDSTGLDFSIAFVQMKPSPLADAGLLLSASKTASAVLKAIDETERLGLHACFRLLPLCVVDGYERYSADMWTRAMTVDDQGNLTPPLTTETCKTERCADCAANNRCPGFLGSYAQLFGDAEFHPLRGNT